MNELEKLEKQIDLCDEIIIDALLMRYQRILDLIEYKQKNDLAIITDREGEKNMARVDEQIKDYRYKKSVKEVYENILYRSKKVASHELFDCNIFLIGFMGAGKSTVSKALHNIFAMEVIEMDQIIAERNGMSISEIFETHGEEYFRNEETNLLIEVQSKKNMIVSCGGGVAMREVNVAEMKKSGRVVLLTAKPETILERVKSSHDRPLLENNKNVEFIADLMEKRRPKYMAAADIIVETDGKSAFEICEEIIKKVNEEN